MNKSRFCFLGEAIVRTPHYPESLLTRIVIDKSVDDVLCSRHFLLLIQLAAPELYHEVERQLNSKKELENKTRTALFKYFERACVRCTPFAAFASLLVSPVGKKYGGVVMQSSLTPKYSLDYQFLNEIISKGETDKFCILLMIHFISVAQSCGLW